MFSQALLGKVVLGFTRTGGKCETCGCETQFIIWYIHVPIGCMMSGFGIWILMQGLFWLACLLDSW